MPKFYVIKDIGGGFDGLTIEGDDEFAPFGFVEIKRMIDRDSIVGDRNVSLTIPPCSLYISKLKTEETADPGIREYAADSPYGKFQLEGRMDCGNLRVTYAQFEKALQVTLTDVPAGRTVTTQNFVKDFDKVKAAIEDVLKSDGSDVDDLVFKLQELKEAEVNG